MNLAITDGSTLLIIVGMYFNNNDGSTLFNIDDFMYFIITDGSMFLNRDARSTLLSITGVFTHGSLPIMVGSMTSILINVGKQLPSFFFANKLIWIIPSKKAIHLPDQVNSPHVPSVLALTIGWNSPSKS